MKEKELNSLGVDRFIPSRKLMEGVSINFLKENINTQEKDKNLSEIFPNKGKIFNFNG
jgi:hypothetical protein